jgi:hypothetical protein
MPPTYETVTGVREGAIRDISLIGRTLTSGLFATTFQKDRGTLRQAGQRRPDSMFLRGIGRGVP